MSEVVVGESQMVSPMTDGSTAPQEERHRSKRRIWLYARQRDGSSARRNASPTRFAIFSQPTMTGYAHLEMEAMARVGCLKISMSRVMAQFTQFAVGAIWK